jgi:23S rRNA pseudouridine1911/1915/1917 synthase
MTLIADREERLDKFLARSLPQFSRTKLAALIGEGGVLVDGKPQKPRFMLQQGMSVSLDEPKPTPAHDLTPAEIPLDVLFEDEHLLVVNKPRGLAAHPAPSLKEPSLVNALLARSHTLSSTGGSFRPGIVHRLDKETTGLLLVAKTDSAHMKLARQIEQRTADRRYLALVSGEVSQPRFSIEAPLARDRHNRLKMTIDSSGRPALTHIKVIETLQLGTLVGAKLATGRTHQIRVHLASIGHPVLGDPLYAPRERQDMPMQLHAAFLAFDHPETGERMSVFAEPPLDFQVQHPLDASTLDPF